MTETDRVCVLMSDRGPIVLRSNPSSDEVFSFVQAQNSHFLAGEAGGPSGEPASKIHNALWFDSEFDWMQDPSRGIPLDISSALAASGKK